MQTCTVEELSSAIRQCLDSKEIQRNAAALGHELSKDVGGFLEDRPS